MSIMGREAGWQLSGAGPGIADLEPTSGDGPNAAQSVVKIQAPDQNCRSFALGLTTNWIGVASFEAQESLEH